MIMLCPSIEEHCARYQDYCAEWLRRCPTPLLELKKEHSFRVLNSARQLVEEESLKGEDRRIALLAALYHDAGRFPQFERWKTFSDAHSEDHGKLGVQAVREQKFLDAETSDVRTTVLAAIALHNKHALSPRVSPKIRQATNIVRDADKLDILWIMAQHLRYPQETDGVFLYALDEPEKWTPSVLSAVTAGISPDYKEIVYINDFKMILASWVHDFAYPISCKLALQQGALVSILDSLPQVDDFVPLRKAILTRLTETK